MAIRKNVRNLSSSEKQELVQAILALKDNNRPGNRWNYYVTTHAQMSVVRTPSNSPRTQPHGGPAFLVWHRYFTYLLERDLQQVSGNSNLALPYWDWTQDGVNSPLWNDDFLGGNGDTTDGSFVLKSGPFRAGNWTIVNEAGNPITYPDNRFNGALKRSFGRDIASLPTSSDINNAIYLRTYSAPPWDQNTPNIASNAIEGYINNSPNIHNRVHRWIGQTTRTSVAPNDPAFFIAIHTNVDRLFARWQSGNGFNNYLPTSSDVYRHNLSDPMLPWNVTPQSTLDYINDLGYSYDFLR